MARWKSLCLLATACGVATAYEVPFADTDYSSQACSGMWGNSKAFINVTFDEISQGQLAMVIYEWNDNQMLGKVTSLDDDSLPKTYVCTSDAVRGGFCDTSNLGKFIIDLPEGKSLNETTFWTARVGFRSNNNTNSEEMPTSAGNESLSSEDLTIRQDSQTGADILWYDQPIRYAVSRTGYYCVAVVPVTVLSSEKRAETDVPFHPPYKGTILFQNAFNGKLPASEYPKVNFYFSLFLLYTLVAAAWGWLCYKHREELLPIQYYLSSLVAFLVIEMVANWAYYRYLNAHGRGTASTVFLFVVAILDAGRNALSFFMLLVVALGLSVVTESLGKTMNKCVALAVAHFVFGVLYAVGIVELELESTSALVLLLFVIPLAFTLSGFLLWIMFALNQTTTQLAARKQRYKLSMFVKLHRILLTVVLVVAIFFVVSSLSFSNRLAEDFAANTWKIRWWLLDGWLALLYLVAFAAIAYLWRPTAHNRRYVLGSFPMYDAFIDNLFAFSTLAMSEELAQEDEDAEDYDLEAIESRSHTRHFDDEDDDATLVGRRGPASVVGEDAVVFEIGDQEMSDDDEPKSADKRRTEQHHGDDLERQGLMNGESHKDD